MRGLRGTALLLLLSGALAGAQPEPPPPVGGGLFFDVLPVTKSGRLLVPLRQLMEWVGVRVEYKDGVIRAYEPGASAIPTVELTVGETTARLAGKPYLLDVPPEVINGRTFVPLRFVAEALGVWVTADGRVVTLSVPQENLEAQMAVAPDPGSHQGKIWALLAYWYGLPGTLAPAPGALLHWDLFSVERKAELLRETGADAATLIEAHWGARPVQGLRVLADALDIAGAATVAVMVKYQDGAVYRDEFSFVLEPAGWRVRVQSSAQMGPSLPL